MRAGVVTTSPAVRLFDPIDYLALPATMATYLEAAFEDGDPKLIAAVLGDIARAKGMTEVAQAAGLGRESLYKALSRDGNPEFATVVRVIAALGLTLKVVPVQETRKTKRVRRRQAR